MDPTSYKPAVLPSTTSRSIGYTKVCVSLTRKPVDVKAIKGGIAELVTIVTSVLG